MPDKNYNDLCETLESLEYEDYIYDVPSIMDCVQEAVNAIKSLQSEKERLTNLINDNCESCACDILEERDRLRSENERLKTKLDAAVSDIENMLNDPNYEISKLCLHWNEYGAGCCCFYGQKHNPKWRGVKGGDK